MCNGLDELVQTFLGSHKKYSAEKLPLPIVNLIKKVQNTIEYYHNEIEFVNSIGVSFVIKDIDDEEYTLKKPMTVVIECLIQEDELEYKITTPNIPDLSALADVKEDCLPIFTDVMVFTYQAYKNEEIISTRDKKRGELLEQYIINRQH